MSDTMIWLGEKARDRIIEKREKEAEDEESEE